MKRVVTLNTIVVVLLTVVTILHALNGKWGMTVIYSLITLLYAVVRNTNYKTLKIYRRRRRL